MSYGVGEGLGFIFDIKGRVEEIYGDWRGILTELETAESRNFPQKWGKSTCYRMIIYPTSAVSRSSALETAVKYCPWTGLNVAIIVRPGAKRS